jgi:hypothetical protein
MLESRFATTSMQETKDMEVEFRETHSMEHTLVDSELADLDQPSRFSTYSMYE